MKKKIYVDGQHGTTGLEINGYLEKHPFVELMRIDYEDRRNKEKRTEALNDADLVFLCLPEEASIEAAGLIKDSQTKVIDASTAFRTHQDWAYGLPELSKDQRQLISRSKMTANPGCHATASILAIAPLIQGEILKPDYPIIIQSITGYSGGGKGLIQKYEEDADSYLKTPRPYALSMKHKHLPEMKKYMGLSYEPAFIPVVSDYYRGLAVSIPIYTRLMQKMNSPQALSDYLVDFYKEELFVKVIPYTSGNDYLLDGGFDVSGLNHTNKAEIFIYGSSDHILLMVRLDNLGKGASAAAIQNMNLMLGFWEGTAIE